jgi:SAM-dependent methyltransferase
VNPRALLSTTRLFLSSLPSYFGKYPRECPICSYQGKFLAYGNPPRWDARCPNCNSFERHRLLALALSQNPSVVRGHVVHFAPEPSVALLVRPLSGEYRSADLFRPADLKLNLEQISLTDQSVDTFVASHILEHVDHKKALSELHRCLRPGGTAILMVPMIEAWKQTYENPSVKSDAERELHFGQFDHVRYFGSDFRQFVKEAGFEVSEFMAFGDDSVRYGLMRGDTIFFAKKISSEPQPSQPT